MTRLETLLAQYEGFGPGCAVLVVEGDGEPLMTTRGYADVERAEPVTADTNFRLASISKQMTASAILKLRAAGRIRLGTTLGELFPDIGAYARPITIEQLLTHTSGLLDYENLLEAGRERVSDRDVFALLAQQDRCAFEPGSEFRYSNSGYCVLACVIEKVSGMTFPEFMRAELFLPMGMEHTFVNEEGVTAIPHRAYGYSKSGEGWSRTDQDATSATMGDGGTYSSVRDLRLWIRHLDEMNLLEKTVPTEKSSPNVRYGFGIFCRSDRDTTVQYHAGSSIGFRSGLYRIPERGLSIVWLSNRNSGDPLALCERYANGHDSPRVV